MNLKVEWRVVSSAQAQASQAGIGGGGVSVSTSDLNQRQDSIHSLLVLNGSRARLYVGRTVPQTTWQFAFSPTNGGTGGGQVQLQSQTTWIDLGQGLTVRPRWRGGAAPVEVEIEAQSRNHVGVMTGANGIAPDGQTQRQEVMSTLAIPLGQWVVVAQSRGNQAQQARGGWSNIQGWVTRNSSCSPPVLSNSVVDQLPRACWAWLPRLCATTTHCPRGMAKVSLATMWA